MKTINIHYAKTHLSRLVEEATQGESFIIAKAGKPMVQVTRLGAHPAPSSIQRLGLLEGIYPIPEHFDTFAEDEIAALFDGEA